MKNKFSILIAAIIFSFITILAKAQTPVDTALTKMGNHDYEGAMEYCNKALSIDPNLEKAFTIRSSLEVILSDYTAAIRDCNKVINANQTQVYVGMAYLNRGIAKYYTDDTAGACIDLHKSADLGDEMANKYITQYCR